MIGGGSLPGSTLPTKLLSIQMRDSKGSSLAEKISKKLRNFKPPVIGRIENDSLLLDPRTVLVEEDDLVIRALKNATS